MTVKRYGEGDISTLFGGYKQSEFGGRGNAIHAHDQYTERKAIWIDLSDRAVEELVGEDDDKNNHDQQHTLWQSRPNGLECIITWASTCTGA